jgi:hypothetical protein
MNKIALSVIASLAVASGALAGQPMAAPSKDYKAPAPTPCFRDTELQLDVFASYTWITSNKLRDNQDGVGGGLGVNYYFTRHIGIGVDGQIFDGGVNGLWTFTGNLLARFPIETGGVCLAPYLLAGGGLAADGSVQGVWNIGGGVEWRIVPEKIGIYAEGRYIWNDEHGDGATARLGVRFVF